LQKTILLLAEEVKEGKWINHGSIQAHLTHICQLYPYIKAKKGETTGIIAVKEYKFLTFNNSLLALDDALVTGAYARELCYSIDKICMDFANLFK
jgi:hypothetical protein